MKVLFVISVRGHGRGGHFHSLNHISSVIGSDVEAKIISIGNGRSPIIEKNSLFLDHIYFDTINALKFRSELKKVLDSYDPMIIHCFDVSAYNIMKLFTASSRYSFVLNKCGGPNPKSYPKVENLVLFSNENKRWFDSYGQNIVQNTYVIPNRVNLKILESKANERPIQKPDKFCLVRITRIGHAYKKSIDDSINLIRLLKSKTKIPVHLFIIGAPEDTEIVDEIKGKSADLPVTLVIEPEFTQKASDLLYLGDVIIATGRGVMEAMASSKPVLTPVVGSEIPVLIDKTNFVAFFETNFSQRNSLKGGESEDSFNKILHLVQDNEYYQSCALYSKDIFSRYFDAEVGIKDYLRVYNKALTTPKSKNIPKLSDYRWKLRTLYSFLKK